MNESFNNRRTCHLECRSIGDARQTAFHELHFNWFKTKNRRPLNQFIMALPGIKTTSTNGAEYTNYSQAESNELR